MNCNIVGCSNSTYRLEKWLTQLCDVHGLKFGSCVCKPPFTLFPFPTERKDLEGRKRWARIVNRMTKTGANWQPVLKSRICSRHFKNGEPTAAWPDPTEHLGYDFVPPKFRRGVPIKRLQYSEVQKQCSQCTQKGEAVHTKSMEQLDRVPVEDEEGSDVVKMELYAEKGDEDKDWAPVTSKATFLIDHDYTSNRSSTTESSEGCRDLDAHIINEEKEEVDENCEPVALKKTFLLDHNYVSNRSSTTDSCQGCRDAQAQILEMEAHVKNLTQKLRKEEMKSKCCESYDITNVVLKSDETVKEFTGIESKQKLECLYRFLEPRVQQERHWVDSEKESSPESSPRVKLDTNQPKPGPKRSLSTLQEFILVLLKLRLALNLTFLAGLFDITPMSVSQIFHTWIKFMAGELSPMTFWPDRISTDPSIPTFLKGKYKHLRCTIDCTEVLIERPEDFGNQARTWSDYIKDHTVKFLVAVAPNGMISFLSKSWGGCASDIHITRKSGFYDLLEPGDVVLANALGLGIAEDLLRRGVKLDVPPPRQEDTEQQNLDDVEETQEITNARMYVEQAVGRIKWFAILKETLPISLAPLVDDIVTVCAALVNLRPPMVK